MKYVDGQAVLVLDSSPVPTGELFIVAPVEHSQGEIIKPAGPDRSALFLFPGAHIGSPKSPVPKSTVAFCWCFAYSIANTNQRVANHTPVVGPIRECTATALQNVLVPCYQVLWCT